MQRVAILPVGICLVTQIVSRFYPPQENSFLICIWNGCSQFGDLLSVLLGYIIIVKGGRSQGYLILVVGILLAFTMFFNWIFLKETPETSNTTVQQSF